jgi:hypothetical protein
LKTTSSYKLTFISCLFFLSALIESKGQHIFSKTQYTLQSNLIFSTDKYTPFWLSANQYGEVPDKSGFISLKGSAHKEYDTLYHTSNLKMKKFGYGYGLRAVINTGKVNQALFSEGYIKVRYGALELYGGRKREVFGLVDTLMSSGSFIWSGNALPIPKIQISIPNYTPVLAKGLLSIKGSFAHGWFGSTDSVKNYYLHQKSLYGRIGKPNWRIKMYAGFNHQVQWAGKPAKPFLDEASGQMISKYQNDFETYIKVVTGVSLNKNSDGVNQPGVPSNEALNRAGNHLGTIDLAIEWEDEKKRILIYRQSIYEDGSLYYLSNISDGLLGVSLRVKNKKSILKHLAFEYLNTMNQGGDADPFLGNFFSELNGRDNYFNNGLYKDGWTYKDKVIGNSFIIPFSRVLNSNTNYLQGSIGKNYLINNRVEAFLISGIYHSRYFQFLTRYTISKNVGSYSNPISKNIQHSFLQNINCHIFKNNELKLSISLDQGKLLKNNFGLNVGIKRSWIY